MRNLKKLKTLNKAQKLVLVLAIIDHSMKSLWSHFTSCPRGVKEGIYDF